MLCFTRIRVIVNTYERLFGSGPRGALIGTVLFIAAYLLEDIMALSNIVDSNIIKYTVFTTFTLLGIVIAIWSVRSLSIKQRGRQLVTTGAFRYFRHPLYAAFASFINIGFSFLLNNWVYLLWTGIMFPVWTLNVKQEERLMRNHFGKEYDDYCARTWRFFPKLALKGT